MSVVTRIMVIARPGHSRDSLVALLKTIPRIDLVLSERDSLAANPDLSKKIPPDILLIDTDGFNNLDGDAIHKLRKAWPVARCAILAGHIYQNQSIQVQGVDCILTKSTPAGEFLQTIRQLIEQSLIEQSRLSKSGRSLGQVPLAGERFEPSLTGH